MSAAEAPRQYDMSMDAQKPSATIRLRPDAFTRTAIRSDLGFRSATALAEAVGVSSSTLRRAIAGESEPGSRLIAALMRGTGKSFDEIAETVAADG